MKKILLTILVICLCSFTLVAAENALTGGIYDYTLEPYRPTSARQLSMGNAGISLARGTEALFVNPAGLANGAFKIAIPSFALTFYNIKDIINPENPMLDKILNPEGGEMNIIGAAVDYLGVVSKYGRNRMADIDAGVVLKAGPIALGLNTQVKLHTISERGTLITTSVLPEINAIATVGLGFKIPLGFMSIDLGANVGLAYKLYTQKISADELSSMLTSEADIMAALMTNYPVMAGYSIPITAGINVNLPLGFAASAVARNINGNYTMQHYAGIDAWSVDVLGQSIAQASEDENANPADPTDPVTSVLGSPFTVDVGASWKWKNGIFSPEIAVDMIDILSFDFENTNKDEFLKHLNIGANIRLLSILDVSAGLNQGYLSAGVGLDLFLVHVEAAYAFREFGSIIGEKGVDSLTIRAVIGYDR